MRKVALPAVIAALALMPSAAAKVSQPVLGIDWTPPASARLAWFDPTSLATVPGRKVPLVGHTWPWAFSPDRSRLAIGGRENAKQLRFVNARTMRPLGQMPLRYAGDIEYVNWVNADHVLAYVQGVFDGTVALVNASSRRIERVTPLSDRVAYGGARFAGGIALLFGKYAGMSPVAVAVADADGGVRIVALDRISVGTTQPTQDGQFETRRPGFAVDPAGRRAFVVDADFTVAEIDLDTLAVTYHAAASRSTSKFIRGSLRQAAWLGDGVLAVSGADYGADETGTAAGLRLIDTNTWTRRFVDSNVASFEVGDGILAGTGPEQDASRRYDVYGFDGRLRYDVDVARLERLSVQGAYAYLCTMGGAALRVLDARSGSGLGAPHRSACPTLLYGQSSS